MADVAAGVLILLFIAAILGYIANIYKAAKAGVSENTKMSLLVVRLVGIVIFPLGAVMGFL